MFANLTSPSDNGAITLLAQQTQVVVAPSGAFTGRMISAVYQEPTGTLDFLYQFRNDSSSTNSADTIDVSSLTGYRTDVGLAAPAVCQPGQGCMSFGPFVSGNEIPINTTRSVSGDTIEFEAFETPIFTFPVNIPAGQASAILMISTDATAYGAGVAIINADFSPATVASFAPAAAPEPGVLSLTMFGILAGVLARRRAVTKRTQFRS